MKASERIVTSALADAGIEINGGRPHDIRVNTGKFFGRVVKEGSLGMGESYMDGWWDCDALDECIALLLKASLREKSDSRWKTALKKARAGLTNMQSRRRAFQVGERHYDIGNDLYGAMLGGTMAYTSAYWKDASKLDEAQTAKMDLVCRKAGLRPGMKVLELGCGWGTFAEYAVKRYGVEVTGLTVSKEQVSYGRERCRGLPVELRLDDYRNACGEFDAVISIGIMEHVGYRNYRKYMETAHRCLKRDGICFFHTIGANRSGRITEPWLHKYIFPNGQLPSIAQLGRAMENLFVMEDWHNFGPDYDRTLLAWHENFEKAWPGLKAKYGDRFRRMWRYYLLSCAGAFRTRYIQLWQVVMTKQGRPRPECRFG